MRPGYPHKESLHPDLHHPPPKPPHWDWTDPYGNQWEYDPATGIWVPKKGNNPNKPQPIFPDPPSTGPAPVVNNGPGTGTVIVGGVAGGAGGVFIYWAISEGLRVVCPPRNLIPIP